MTGQLDFRHIIDQFRINDDPVKLMQSFIVQTGGYWAAHGDKTLYEVQLLGVAGVGVGSEAAVRNWLANAQKQQLGILSAT